MSVIRNKRQQNIEERGRTVPEARRPEYVRSVAFDGSTDGTYSIISTARLGDGGNQIGLGVAVAVLPDFSVAPFVLSEWVFPLITEAPLSAILIPVGRTDDNSTDVLT